MKLRLFGSATAALTLVLFLITPAWSAETQAQETPPAEAAPVQAAIQIKDTAVSQDVVDRVPVGSGDVFPKETAKLYCYTRVVGAAGETQVTHNWYHQGTLKSSVKLSVRSNNWRTWSSKTMAPEWTGEWMVEILSEEGTPLESIIFFME